jgi:hypothetical protein
MSKASKVKAKLKASTAAVQTSATPPAAVPKIGIEHATVMADTLQRQIRVHSARELIQQDAQKPGATFSIGPYILGGADARAIFLAMDAVLKDLDGNLTKALEVMGVDMDPKQKAKPG